MALGKSLGNILGDYFGEETVQLQSNALLTSYIAVNDIETSPHQTRSEFDDDKLKELAHSIKTNGLVHPIVVIKKTSIEGDEKRYRLLVGERRLRAVRYLGNTTILAVIREERSLSTSQQALITATENLQREDLSPIELAQTFEMLLSSQAIDETKLSQQLNTSAQYIKNYLRLLTLCDEVKQALLKKQIGEGHARHLVGLAPNLQQKILESIISEDLTVKEIEQLVKKINSESLPKSIHREPKQHLISNEILSHAERLAQLFPKSKLKYSGNNKKGKITISWG